MRIFLSIQTLRRGFPDTPVMANITDGSGSVCGEVSKLFTIIISTRDVMNITIG